MIILKDYCRFTLLKRIFYILIFIVGLNFTSFAQTKSTDPAAKLLKFYPNPATTVINFDFLHGYDKSYSFQIYAFMGKKVYEVNNTPPRISVTLDDFYRGIYLYKLLDKNGKVIESGKFIVVK